MRECLSIMFACYDGHTYIRWRTPSGEERLGLLALCSLVVDGGDYDWLVNNRGPTSLFGCGGGWTKRKVAAGSDTCHTYAGLIIPDFRSSERSRMTSTKKR